MLHTDIGDNGPLPLVLAVPQWWIAAAEFEARWIVSGKPVNRDGKDVLRTALAREFTAERGGGKSAATITKMRADPRYQQRVSRLVIIGLMNVASREREIATDPEGYRLRQAEWTAVIEASYDAVEGKPGRKD